jgi:hypothetical protein
MPWPVEKELTTHWIKVKISMLVFLTQESYPKGAGWDQPAVADELS